MQLQDQYLNKIKAILQLDIAQFNQSVMNDQWEKGIPNFQKSQLSYNSKHDIKYMEKIINSLKQTCVSPQDVLFKSMLLLVIKKIVKFSDQNIIRYAFNELIYEYYQIQSPILAKFYRKTIHSVMSTYIAKNSMNYIHLTQKLVQKLKKRQNLLTNLTIMICFFKLNKFILTSSSSQTKRNQFLQICFSHVVDILKQNIQVNPLIVMTCCKLISNSMGFPECISLFYQKNTYHKWVQCFCQILKSKWYFQDYEQKYTNLDSLQSIYLHSKKSVVKALNSFMRRQYRAIKQKKSGSKSKSKNKLKKKQKQQDEQNFNQTFKQIMKEIISQLEYQCYPSKVRILQILFIREIMRFCGQSLQIELLIRSQNCLYKFMILKPEEEEKIVLKPYQYELYFRDYIFHNNNIRVLAACVWNQISFQKNKSFQSFSQQNIKILKNFLQSDNLLQFQMGLTILSFIQYDYLRLAKLENQPIVILNTIINKIASSSSVVIRVSAFRALYRGIEQNSLDCLSDTELLNWAQIAYDHLTKDEAILVRICAGSCFLKLSLKERCVQQFKLGMYQSLVVLLKIIQQVSLEAIGGLINSVLRIKQYEKIIMPLSKQILQYSLGTFVEILSKKLKYSVNEEQEQMDSLLLLTQCSQMIEQFIINLSSNDLLPEGPIQQKLYNTFISILQLFSQNNKIFQQTQQQVGECLLKIFSAVMLRSERCQQKLMDIFVVNMKSLLTKQTYLYNNLNISNPLINLTKHIQKNPNACECLQLITTVRHNVSESGQSFTQVFLYLLDYYIIVNVLSNPNIRQLCAKQCEYLNIIINNRYFAKFSGVVKTGVTDNFVGCYKSIGMFYSGVVMCLYDTLVLASGMYKQILNFTNNLFTDINKKYDKNYVYQGSMAHKALFKIYILANLTILSRILQNPNLTYQKQQAADKTTNFITSLDISKTVQNIITLFNRYIKILSINQLINNDNQPLSDQNQDQENQVSMQDQFDSNVLEDDDDNDMMQEGQMEDQNGFEEFKFDMCYDRVDNINQLDLLNNVVQNKRLEQLIPGQSLQKLNKIASKLKKVNINQQEIVSMMIKN